MLKLAFSREVLVTFNPNHRLPFYSKQYLIFAHSAITTDISKSTNPWFFEQHVYLPYSQQTGKPRTDSVLPSLTSTRWFNKQHSTKGALQEETFCKTVRLADTPNYPISLHSQLQCLVWFLQNWGTWPSGTQVITDDVCNYSKSYQNHSQFIIMVERLLISVFQPIYLI